MAAALSVSAPSRGGGTVVGGTVGLAQPSPSARRCRPTAAALSHARSASAAAAGPGPSSSFAAAGLQSRRRPGAAAKASSRQSPPQAPPAPRGRERAASAAVAAVARLGGGGGGEVGGGPSTSPAPRHARRGVAARAVTSHHQPSMDAEDEGGGVGGGNQTITLPRPTHTRVRTAEYISSAVDLAGCPPPSVPEFALIGRSNVGKSSLINALTGRKALAQVSKQPGKTRTINHFLVNGAGPAPWYLVDLPGYGYARAGAEHRLAWASFSQTFFLERPTLASVLLLADGSLPPQAADLECAAWLAGAGVPFCVVLTKADKRVKAKGTGVVDAAEAGVRGGGPSAAAAAAAALAAALSAALGGGPPPPMLATSASTGAGRNELLTYIAQLRVLASGGAEQREGGGARVVTGGAPDDVPDDEWW